MYQKKYYLCIDFKSKLTTPSMNANRTRGSLVQATAVVGLTSSQLVTSTVTKNISVCSSSCKNNEVFGIPSFTCREGKARFQELQEDEEVGSPWIYLPYNPDLEQPIFKATIPLLIFSSYESNLR
jgi:hypothetical protein